MKYFYNGKDIGYSVGFSEDDRSWLARLFPNVARLEISPKKTASFTFNPEGNIILTEGIEIPENSGKEMEVALKALAEHCAAYGRTKYNRDVQRGKQVSRLHQRKVAEMAKRACEDRVVPRGPGGNAIMEALNKAMAILVENAERLDQLAKDLEQIRKAYVEPTPNGVVEHAATSLFG